jgi:hypothetical protein
MASSLVVLDSNIIIDYLNRIPQARTVLLSHPDALINSMVWMEVLTGDVETPREYAARRLLAQFHKVELTLAIQERAVLVRKRTRLKLPDAIIYATAEEHNAILITRNAKDFPQGDPRIVVPYEL